jgi:hypothetical protein
MRIITHTCDACGTIVSANELESNRVMKCPGLNCQEVLRFDEIAKHEREYFLEHRERHQI